VGRGNGEKECYVEDSARRGSGRSRRRGAEDWSCLRGRVNVRHVGEC
jgi:hypothetical protein